MNWRDGWRSEWTDGAGIDAVGRKTARQPNQSQSLPVVPWCLVLGTSASQEPDQFQGQGWGQLGPVDCETARLQHCAGVLGR